MLARALEQVGDRWSLLVVRDLLPGPRRFSDLMARLGGITPKTLSQRLRELEASGIVDVDRQPGRRDVWYRLTPAGQDLAPAVESPFRWGVRHASRKPLPGEAVHAEHLLEALRIVLETTPPPGRTLAWRFDFVGAGSYVLRHTDGTWHLNDQRPTAEPLDEGDHSPADVTVTASTDAWARFLTTPPAERPSQPEGVALVGARREVRRFLTLLARFPYAS
jgi:DNA-binding HxlR family transcriptional regulator